MEGYYLKEGILKIIEKRIKANLRKRVAITVG